VGISYIRTKLVDQHYIFMLEKISVQVSVSMLFDSKTGKIAPKIVIWNGRVYKIAKVGLHHTYMAGRTLFHVFSVVSGGLFFRLVLNTETLHWRLEEVSDGMPG